jgi:hypothetical protein
MRYPKALEYSVHVILFTVGYRYGLENGKQKAQARQDVSDSMAVYIANSSRLTRQWNNNALLRMSAKYRGR